EKEKEEKLKETKATLKDLWIRPNIRKKTFILYFTWFVNSFVYYGISLNTNALGGNAFLSFALAGLVEVPSYILTRFGRRMPLMWAMLGGGIGCLATIPFSTNDDYVWMRVSCAMVGKFCVTASYAMIYVYSAELYPTVARNVGVGSSSMVARIGSIMAPFVKELSQYTHIGLVMAIFGCLSIADAFLVLLLPETKGKEIPDTIEEAENFGNSRKIF
ncbi:organic cation transporter protein-like protein, partial [Leptotrombidium deliense]